MSMFYVLLGFFAAYRVRSYPDSSSAMWKIRKQQLGFCMQQLIFMFYIIPSDSFNTPERINNSREGGRQKGGEETNTGGRRVGVVLRSF